MNSDAPNPAPTVCPRCGGTMSQHGLRGLCRRCVARYSLPQSDAPRQPGSGLGISCPQCGHRIELPEGQSLSDIRCDSCGTHFSVVDDQAAKESAANLGRVGQFNIVEKLGTGAFGTVWKAHDTRLARWVAIKIPRHRHLELEEAEKFLREARAAAQLHHPNIVSVFEVGREDDLVYIVCDFVEGVSLADRLAAKRIGVREAAQLCRKLASALEHAHGQGVIHRDIKPGNILLDAQGEPHLTDFGLARREAGEVTLTMDGQLLGTPAYMSPELARGEAHQADARTDLYSLGVVLFQLLTGELPFRGNTRMLVQQVIHDEPPSPRRLNAHIPRDLETICLKCLEKEPGQRYTSARELGEELDRFLRGEPIQARSIGPVGRAWRWSRRKPALAALTGAVALLLLTVTAVSVTAAWRIATARKAEQRESYYSSIALAKQHIEQGSIDRALEVLWKCPERYRHWEWGHLLYLCHQDMVSLNAQPTNVVALDFSANNRWLVSLDAAGRARVWDWEAQQEVFALGDGTNRVSVVAFSPKGGQLAAAVGTNGVQVWAVGSWQEVHRLVGHNGGVSVLGYSPDGRRLATAGTEGTEGTVKVWDAVNGQELFSFMGPVGTVRRVAISPDAKRLVAVAERSVRVWDLEAGTLLRTFPDAAGGVGPTRPKAGGASNSRDAAGLVPAREIFVVFADDTGEHFATIDTPGHFVLWHEGTAPQTLITIRGTRLPTEQRAFFSPDGRWVLNGGNQNTARLWDVHTGIEQLGISERVDQTRFSADAARMVTVGAENWATVWDLPKARKLNVLRGHDRLVESVAIGRDGRLVATGDERGVVKVWRAAQGREFLEEELPPWCTAYSPDGRWIVACPGNEGWVLRSAQSGRTLLRVQALDEGYMPLFSPDSRQVATWGSHKTAKVWEAESGRLLLTLRGHRRQVFSLAYSRDGRFIATGSADGTAKLWDATTGAELRTLFVDRATPNRPPSRPRGRGLGPVDARAIDDRQYSQRSRNDLGEAKARRAVATTSAPAATGGPVAVHPGSGLSTNLPEPYDLTSFDHIVASVEFDADGSRLFTGTCDGKARVWDLRTGALVSTLEAAETAAFVDVKLHPDGNKLLTQTQDRRLRLWDIKSGRLLKEWNSRGFHINGGLGVSADARRLAAESSLSLYISRDSGTIEVCDLETSPREVLTLTGPELFAAPSFSSGLKDRRIMAGSGDCAIHQWEAFPWETDAYARNGEGEKAGGRDQESGDSSSASAGRRRSSLSTLNSQLSTWSLAERVRRYADRYWRERFAAEYEAEASNTPPKVLVVPVDRSLFPRRDLHATPKQIDLTDYYTGELTEPFFVNGDGFRQDNDLSNLPTGLVTFGGVRFDVRGVIQLRLTILAGGISVPLWSFYPDRIEGIPVEQEGRRIHLLLGAHAGYDLFTGAAAYPGPEGATVGTVVLHYADGETARLDLVYGSDVRDWWHDPSQAGAETIDRGKVVWTGTNPVAQEFGLALRLYLTSRENPRPDAKIVTVDFVSALSRSAPFLIALTIE